MLDHPTIYSPEEGRRLLEEQQNRFQKVLNERDAKRIIANFQETSEKIGNELSDALDALGEAETRLRVLEARPRHASTQKQILQATEEVKEAKKKFLALDQRMDQHRAAFRYWRAHHPAGHLAAYYD